MLVDTHAHMDRYPASRRSEALAELETLDIVVLSVTTSPIDLFRLDALVADNDRIVPCFGVHPRRAYDYRGNLEVLEPLIAKSTMLGEIGLDHSSDVDFRSRRDQLEVFEFFLHHAASQRKIINIRARAAELDVADAIRSARSVQAIVHACEPTTKTMSRLLEEGCYVSVGYEALLSKRHQDIARAIPEERLLMGTNNPLAQHRAAGSWGMPDVLTRIAAQLARVRGLTPSEVGQLGAANLLRLIAGDERLGRLSNILTASTGAHA